MFSPPKTLSPTFYDVPTVYVKETVARKMQRICNKVPTGEVGWLCVVHRNDDGDFVISDWGVPLQDCHSTTTELTPQGQASLLQQMAEEDIAAGIDPDSPDFRVKHMNCWCHSHGSMGVSPSGQDDTQIAKLCEGGNFYDFWVRGIVNKAGDAHFSVYYRAGPVWITVVGCPVEVMWENCDDLDKEVDELIKERVRHKSYPTATKLPTGNTRYKDYSQSRGRNRTWNNPKVKVGK